MAPLLIPLLGVLMAAAGVYWLGNWARTTVVVLVRHAEAGESASGDPDLSAAGEKRVASLGTLLGDVLADRKVDYLYAADTRRAQQTAAPVANEFKLPINVVASSDWPGPCRTHQAGAPGQDRCGRGVCDDAARRDQPVERDGCRHARRRIRRNLRRGHPESGRNPRAAAAVWPANTATETFRQVEIVFLIN